MVSHGATLRENFPAGSYMRQPANPTVWALPPASMRWVLPGARGMDLARGDPHGRISNQSYIREQRGK